MCSCYGLVTGGGGAVDRPCFCSKSAAGTPDIISQGSLRLTVLHNDSIGT